MALFQRRKKNPVATDTVATEEQKPLPLEIPQLLRNRIQAQKDEYQKQSEALRQQTETIIHLLVDGYVSGLDIQRGSKVEFDYDTLNLKITPPDEVQA